MSMAIAATQRTGEWLADPGFGVYVHIPFCLHRCHYCDFNTYEGLDSLHAPYVDALVADVERWAGETRPATSVFFGGGTPTLLDPLQLGRILDAVRCRVGIEPGAEVTIEANPETVDEAKFEGLLDAGFNRVSIGVQSLVPHVLRGLGRTHSPRRALEALTAARRAGVADVNADLIYGSPWERAADWQASLRGIVDAGPDHVSAYALTIEEATPLGTLVRTGRIDDVDPDVQADRYATATEVLGDAGYERYEVSNWARPGRASRHNVLYWSAGDYLGFGAGAHGHIAGRRWWCMRLPRDFLAAVRADETTEAGSETLAGATRADEALMLGLRLASGIDEEGFSSRFGPDALASRAPVIRELVASGSLVREAGRLRVASDALFVLDDIVRRLM